MLWSEAITFLPLPVNGNERPQKTRFPHAFAGPLSLDGNNHRSMNEAHNPIARSTLLLSFAESEHRSTLLLGMVSDNRGSYGISQAISLQTAQVHVETPYFIRSRNLLSSEGSVRKPNGICVSANTCGTDYDLMRASRLTVVERQGQLFTMQSRWHSYDGDLSDQIDRIVHAEFAHNATGNTSISARVSGLRR